MILLGLVGNCVSQATPVDNFQLIERIKRLQEEVDAAAKEKYEKRCNELAADIYAELMRETDLRESQMLEQMGVFKEEPLKGDEYTLIMSNRMYEDNKQLPRRTALMREVCMRLNKTERGKRILILMSKEIAARRAIQCGDKNEASIIYSQLKNDYEDFDDWNRNTGVSKGIFPFSTVISARASISNVFLHSENGEAPVKEMWLVEVVDNPYKEGKVGMLPCGYMPSTNSPAFVNKICGQIQDTMSLAEIYSLLRRELGKGATPYIFALKIFGNCISKNDETEMRQYVQMRTYSNGTYADPEATYLLARYLWGDDLGNPFGTSTKFESWKEGYIMMMRLAYQGDERALVFIMSFPCLRAALDNNPELAHIGKN